MTELKAILEGNEVLVQFDEFKGCVSLKVGGMYVSFNPRQSSVMTNVNEVLDGDSGEQMYVLLGQDNKR